MADRPIVSLCIPTNGVAKWVIPVLDSIFNQNVDSALFEVVITDNGDNREFKEKMKEYRNKYSNIVYAETNALPFLNEIESYKRANGMLIKFVNHRTMIVDGALKRMINFAKDNEKEKPIVYFANGVLELSKMQHTYDDFDQFVRNLSYWSSWSTGMTIWKEDFDKLPEDVSEFNELFPHTTVLFRERNRGKYVIDNTIIMNELPTENIPKGRYDLFGAFGIEYPGIICNLLRDGSITNETYRFVADKNLEFIAGLYWDFCVKKRQCSYNLSGLDNIFGVYYTEVGLKKKIVQLVVKKIAQKILKR